MIATKGGLVRGGRELSTIDAIGNPNYLRQCAYLSARRLGVDQIDLYYLHSGRARDASFEDQVGALAELRKEGLIRHIGLSNVTAAQLRAALADHRDRRRHRVLQRRRPPRTLRCWTPRPSAGAVFGPWQPVSLTPPGVPADTSGPQTFRRVLRPIAARHGATIPQVALAWLLARSPRCCRSRPPPASLTCGRTWRPRTSS